MLNLVLAIKGANNTEVERPMLTGFLYPISTLALIFPPMSPGEYQRLVESIAKHGLRDKIVIWRGMIVDGVHRLKACEAAGMEPGFEFLDDDADPVSYVLDKNATRRTMRGSDRAVCAHRFWELLSGGNLLEEEMGGANLHSVAGEELWPKSQWEVAALFGVSKRSLNYAGVVLSGDSPAVPAVRALVEEYRVKVSDAAAVVCEPPEVQQRAAEALNAGRARTLKRALKVVRDEEARLKDTGILEMPLWEDLEKGPVLVCSKPTGLRRLVPDGIVDAVILRPLENPSELSLYAGLAAMASHVLGEAGAMIVVVSSANLAEFLRTSAGPDMKLIHVFPMVFDQPLNRARNPHSFHKRSMLALVFGKSKFVLEATDDVIRVPALDGAERGRRAALRLQEAGMEQIMLQFTKPGQVVCDPVLLGWPATALAAVTHGRKFIGADEEQYRVDMVDRVLARAKDAGNAPNGEGLTASSGEDLVE